MKKITGVLLLLTVMIMSANQIKATDCTSKEGVCAIYDKKNQKLKLYGNNSIGQLGVSKDIKSVSKEEAIDINALINEESISAYKITKNNVIVSASPRVYISGSNNINQLGIKNRINYYQFIENKYLNTVDSYGDSPKIYINSDGTTKGIAVNGEFSYANIFNGKISYGEYQYVVTHMNTPTYDKHYVRDIESNKLLEKRLVKNYHNYKSKNHKTKQYYTRTQKYNYTKAGKIYKYSKTYTFIKFNKNYDTKETNVVVDKYDAKYNNTTLTYKYRITRNTNNKVTLRDKYTLNKTKKDHLKIKYVYKKGTSKLSKKYRYVYNKANELKSNKNGKSYRYITYFNNKGKAAKTVRQQYLSNGKLSKKIVKVKIIK